MFQNIVGFADLDTKLALRQDAVFDVRSLSKPITAIGAMLLSESGELSLGDLIERHLPEFRGIQFANSGGLRVPPRRPTVLDLLTHTSGIPAERPASSGPILKMKLDLLQDSLGRLFLFVRRMSV